MILENIEKELFLMILENIEKELFCCSAEKKENQNHVWNFFYFFGEQMF